MSGSGFYRSTTSTVTISNSASRFAFLDVLRTLAALLVVWDHFVGTFCERNRIAFVPLEWVRYLVTKPLGIIQDFGFIGVALFFYISGFIITHIIMKESVGVFAIRRFFRIYPPLIISIVIAILVVKWQNGVNPYSMGQILRACSLINYIWTPQIPINGVAWTLIIEVIFYILVAIQAPILRAKPFLAILASSMLTGVIFYNARSWGESFFLFSASVAYMPFLLTGQIIYLFFNEKKIKRLHFILMGLIQYLLLIWALYSIHKNFLPITNSYIISATYALILFLIFYRFPTAYFRIPFFHIIANHTYSIYLFHAVAGVPVLVFAFAKTKSYPCALFCAIAVTALMSGLACRLVEKPSIKFGQKLSALVKNNLLN
jgi:peptidoglycan/LPS O-acetylase OafA/YrhL